MGRVITIITVDRRHQSGRCFAMLSGRACLKMMITMQRRLAVARRASSIYFDAIRMLILRREIGSPAFRW